MSNDVARARRELARRELARRGLINFCAYVDPAAALPDVKDSFVQSRYRWPHLELTARYLETAETGGLWRNVPGSGLCVLIITMGPGHWKTSLVTRKFTPFFCRQAGSGQKASPSDYHWVQREFGNLQ